MIHEPKTQFLNVVICTGTFTESAGFNISLTFAGAEENITPPALFYHAPGDVMVLVLNSVVCKLRTVIIPFKVRLDLIQAIFEVGIKGEIICSVVVLDRPDTLYGCLNWVDNAHCIYIPDKSRLPVD